MRALLLPLGCVLALAPVACSSDEPTGPRAKVGDVVVHRAAAAAEGQHAYVVVPGRRVDFLVSRPRPELDAASAEDAGVETVPVVGAAVVEVAWTLAPADGDWYAALADTVTDDAPDVTFTLVAGTLRFDLGAPDQDGPHAAYVVVPDDTEAVDVEVTYDGLTQRVQVVGSDPVDQPIDAPPGLYSESPRQTAWDKAAGVGEGTFTGGNISTRALSPTPYVAGLGWAPEGRLWVLVDVAVNGALASTRAGGERVAYVVDGADAVVRLDGAAPDRLLPLGSPRPELDVVGEENPGATGITDVWRAQAVFLVRDTLRTAELRVTRPLEVRPAAPTVAARRGAPADLDTVLRYDRKLVF